MDKTYNVKITSQTEEQIQEIIPYITYDLKALDAAFHLLNALEDSFTSLTHFPQRIVLVDEVPWHSIRGHRLSVKDFLVYFWIDENDIKVQVIAVIDQLHQLSQIDRKGIPFP